MPVKFQTYAKDVKLAPGETLAFQRGKGYFAKPAQVVAPRPAPPLVSEHGQWTPDPRTGLPTKTPVLPKPPVPPVDPYGPLSAAEIARRAGLEAQQGIDAQSAEIRRQQALAAAQALAQEQAIQGYSDAATKLLAGLDMGSPYADAAKETGDLAQGLSQGMKDRVTAAQAADQAFAESQGQSGGGTVDPTALGDTTYMLGGYVPGASLAEQGAAADVYGKGLSAVQVAAGRGQLDEAMAAAKQANDQYAQQLIDIAKQYPQLRDDALQKLQQYEIDKANFRLQRTQTQANIKAQQADTARQDRALRDNEQAAGLSAKQKADETAFKWAQLQFQSAKEVERAKEAAAKAAQEGRRIDAAASKVAGHLVDRNGKTILGANGKPVPVAKSASGTKAADPNAIRAKAATQATSFLQAAAKRGKATPPSNLRGAAKRNWIAQHPQGAPAMTYTQAITGLLQEVRPLLIQAGMKDENDQRAWVVSRVNTYYPVGTGGRKR